MGIFLPYEGLSLKMKQELKREHVKVNLMDAVKKGVANWIRLNAHQGQVTQETLALVHELIHYGLYHHVYYVPKEVAGKLEASKIKVTLSQLRLPYTMFEVSFEEGSGLPGVLVSITPDDAVWHAYRGALVEGCKDAGVDFTIDDRTNRNMVTIRFQSPVDGGLVHAVIPAAEFEGKTIDEAVEILGSIRNVTDLLMPIPMDPVDREIQKKLLRVIFGLLAYNSVPDADIIDHKDRNRPTMGTVKAHGLLVGNNIRKQTWFIRSGGPMVLSHKRYSRADDGKVRVVWRRAAEVNKHAKAADPQATRKIHKV